MFFNPSASETNAMGYIQTNKDAFTELHNLTDGSILKLACIEKIIE